MPVSGDSKVVGLLSYRLMSKNLAARRFGDGGADKALYRRDRFTG